MKLLNIPGGRNRDRLSVRGVETDSKVGVAGFSKNRDENTSGVGDMGAAVVFTKSEICGRACATSSMKQLSSGRRKREPLIV
jgi:hypothetical protein